MYKTHVVFYVQNKAFLVNTVFKIPREKTELREREK